MSLSEKIKALATSYATDEDRLQVLIHLTAELALHVDDDNTEDEGDFELDRDEWHEKRRCPDCHDDATAYNVNACPTCMGEGWIE